MYRSNHLTGFGGADTVKFEVTHVVNTGLVVLGATANPLTVSSVNLGSFGGTKHVILGLYCNAEPGPITGVTIGGQTATIVIEEGSGVHKQTQNAIVICELTGVTTGDIVITTTGTYDPSKYAISVFQMTKGSITPTDTWGPDYSTNPTGTINIAAGGFCISQASALTSSTFTWSGLTERFDASANPAISVAADFDMSAETGRSITATPSGSPSQRVGIGASFEAA